MKQKISITIDEKMIKLIEALIEEGQFRNRSHILDYSLKKFLEENLNNKFENKKLGEK